MCLRYMHSIQAHSIPGTTFVPHFEPLHFIPLSFHVYTSAPHRFGSFLPFHSAGSIHTVSHYPSPFSTHYQWSIFILGNELANIMLKGWTESNNTFVRANPRIKPRKPLLIFIEGLFQVAMKIIKGFQNMGTDIKLLSAACSLFSTSCISSFAPPPYSCCRKQKHSVLIYPCACSIYIPFKPIPFQELRSFLTSNPYISPSLKRPSHKNATTPTRDWPISRKNTSTQSVNYTFPAFVQMCINSNLICAIYLERLLQ
jgi:hypothetical protein